MSEMAWMRILQRVSIDDPEEMSQLAEKINRKFDEAQRHDPNVQGQRELAWRQAYSHQLAKIAAGIEVAQFGPWVQPFPGSGMLLQPIFYSDYRYDNPEYNDPDGERAAKKALSVQVMHEDEISF